MENVFKYTMEFDAQKYNMAEVGFIFRKKNYFQIECGTNKL